MTEAERVQEAATLASDHAYDHVGWGWYIADPDDAKAAGQTT